MKTLTANEARYGLGRVIDLARAEPVAVAKHKRPAVIAMAVEVEVEVEEYKRLTALELTKVLAFADEYNHWHAPR